MRRSLIGLALAWLLLGLLWLSTAAQAPPPRAESTPPPALEISQVPGLLLTATVGTTPNTCAITNTVQVRADTPLYYCYTITYTGTQPVAVHRVQSSRPGVISTTITRTVQPGETLNTVTLGLALNDRADVDATNFVTWTASTLPNATTPQTVTALARAHIDVVGPALTLFKTVGQDSTGCPSTQEFRVPNNSTVYYCLTIINRGDVTLTRHTLVDADPALGVNGTFDRVLPPGDRLIINNQSLSSFGLGGTLARFNVTQPITSSARVTSITASNLTATGVATAVVDVGTTTVLFTKTVSADPHVCTTAGTIVEPPGRQLYYCASILNTGQVTLTHHEITEQNLSIDLRFDYDLGPGQLLVITNTVLTDILDQPRVFGPFNFVPQFSTVVNNTMNYVGRSVDGFTVVASSATFASFVPTATPTFTPTPRPTSTPRPTITPLPTPTFTPGPPTDTPTPTFTPTPTETPTPTRDWAASFISTPTPAQPSGSVPAQDTPFDSTFDTPTPTATDAVSAQLTAIAAAETEIAATATALVMSTPEFLFTETPTPTPSPSATLFALETDTPLAPAVPAVPDTATPDALILVVTNTPDPFDVQRPVVLPTPTPTLDTLLAAARSVDALVATAGWIWFLGGSLIFFVTAGIVAGLFFYQREQQRFDLVEDVAAAEDELWDDDAAWADADAAHAERPPEPPRGPYRPPANRPRRRDDWPTDLP